MTEEAPILSKETLQLYKDYVGIKDPNELCTHLINIKNKLSEEGKVNYRCIQQYEFAFSRIYYRFFYKRILDLAQQVEKPYFLDIGCCTEREGTDLRKLLLDGYPKEYLIGLDIEQSYIDCGYELFGDSATTCPIQFIVRDLLKSECMLKEKMTVIHAGSVFHLFLNLDDMRQFLKKLIGNLKWGGLLVGGHVCAEKSRQFFRQSTQRLKFYLGIDEFKQLLQSEGFQEIEIETKPRISSDEETFTAFWVSFCAIYQPDRDKQ
ncbi:hypothetical protein EDC94DRAFT_694887 [Helicostylum pulchrum]|nr:hypothetical protein EDC94DRAFT_694887 [Helicostylum pulchrum]